MGNMRLNSLSVIHIREDRYGDLIFFRKTENKYYRQLWIKHPRRLSLLFD